MRLWDAATGQPIGHPMAHKAQSHAVVFSPDGRTVLTGSDDAYSPDGKTILSISIGKTARLWDTATGHPIGHPWSSRPNEFRDVQPRRQDRPLRE